MGDHHIHIVIHCQYVNPKAKPEHLHCKCSLLLLFSGCVHSGLKKTLIIHAGDFTIG